jgi:hypothetical protein
MKAITLSHDPVRQEQHACLPGRDFGPVLAVTTFKTMEEALEIANDTQYGLGRASGAATAIWPIRWAWHSGRTRVDKLLSRLSGTCGVWRVQTIGDWARNAQDDAGTLPANEMPAGQLL